MKLAPIKSAKEPAYPTYQRSLRRVAAAVAASAALLLPACGDRETCSTGEQEPEPRVEEVRPPGTVVAPHIPVPEIKPTEPPPPVQPDPPPRLSGAIVPATPPQPVDPPPRLAGRIRMPEPPKHNAW